MKTPIRYGGGKQQLAERIIALIPMHECYVEPFFGAVRCSFAKECQRLKSSTT